MADSFEFSQEFADLLRLQHELDYADAGPKAPYNELVHLGVTLSSRYDALSEYVQMQKALDAMPEILARRLESIFCDSKACASYSVIVRSGMDGPLLPNAVFEAFVSLGGFNWLEVECDGQRLLQESGYWPGEDGFE
jgi:hypothetical protein